MVSSAQQQQAMNAAISNAAGYYGAGLSGSAAWQGASIPDPALVNSNAFKESCIEVVLRRKMMWIRVAATTSAAVMVFLGPFICNLLVVFWKAVGAGEQKDYASIVTVVLGVVSVIATIASWANNWKSLRR